MNLGGFGKRAWNSNFSGGLGKRAWNSGFSGIKFIQQWNQGFKKRSGTLPLIL